MYGMYVWYGMVLCSHACMHGWMDGCMYVYIYMYIFWVGYFQKSCNCSHLHQPGALYGHAFVSGRQRHVRNLVGPASHFAGDPSQTEIDAGFPHEKR